MRNTMFLSETRFRRTRLRIGCLQIRDWACEQLKSTCDFVQVTVLCGWRNRDFVPRDEEHWL